MGFRVNNFASVWEVKPGRGNTTTVRLTTSRKNKQTNEYEQDFSGFCTFIGNAMAKASSLKPKDRIKLIETDVTTYYDKQKETEYVTYKVFDFEPADGTSATTAKTAEKKTTKKSAVTDDEGESDEDNLPF